MRAVVFEAIAEEILAADYNFVFSGFGLFTSAFDCCIV